MSKILEKLDELNEARELFEAKHRQELASVKSENEGLRTRVEELESRRGTPGLTGEQKTDKANGEIWIDQKTGEKVPLLSHKDRFADIGEPNKTGVSVGKWLRAVLTGKYSDSPELKDLASSPDSAGGYTVPAVLAREFIDALRARLVLSRAGARMVPMTSKTLSLAKITADGAAGWHAENASITPVAPTFGVATLTAKTVVAVVKLSLELSQDSLNVEQMLTRSLTGSLAAAIDSAGLGNTVSNGPSGILSFTGRAKKTGVGAITADYDDFLDGIALLLANNVALENIGPVIVGTHAWRDLAKAKTGISSDKTTLVQPWALTQPFLTTTAVETLNTGASPYVYASTAYLADWADLLYGVRQDITIRVLNEVFLPGTLQIAVLAYARVDFQPAREASFCTLEGITSAP